MFVVSTLLCIGRAQEVQSHMQMPWRFRFMQFDYLLAAITVYSRVGWVPGLAASRMRLYYIIYNTLITPKIQITNYYMTEIRNLVDDYVEYRCYRRKRVYIL